ncbi:allantoicase [Colwellia sp. RE-S-Sl-9]
MIENTQQQNKLTGESAELALKLKTHYVDLASERVGGETLSCSDDFFAEMENLLKSGRGIFIDDKYTERGKWMDGWESRRSYGRDNGREFDWCIIRLGIRGVIKGFDIDTNYFRGNAPQTVSVEACVSEVQPNDDTVWHTILAESAVEPHSQNLFELTQASAGELLEKSWTHVRLNMFPDGGIARFRVYGEADVSWDDFVAGELVDLAYIKNGGKALLVSDMFFSDKNNLIMPGRGKDMGDGWETKRRRDPGPDWSIVKLGQSGTVEKVIIDTCHFKGNYPDSFKLEGTITMDDDFTQNNARWEPIIEQTKLYAHREHLFINEIIKPSNIYTHVRLSIYPDGGISRMRVFGKGSELGADLNTLDEALGGELGTNHE